jgi:hypothetical protein
MRALILLMPMVLLSACSPADPSAPAARSTSPYVDALRDARSVGAASDASTRAREAAIQAAQP